jgi:hypothetical protein
MALTRCSRKMLAHQPIKVLARPATLWSMWKRAACRLLLRSPTAVTRAKRPRGSGPDGLGPFSPCLSGSSSQAAGLVLHRPGTAHPKNWVIPFLLWLAITIRIVTLYIPITIIYKPLQMIWRNTVSRGVHMIPEKLRIPLGALGTVAVIVVGGFASPTSGDNNLANRAISLLGLALLILGMWATSRNRKAVNWHTIIMGMVCSRAAISSLPRMLRLT